MAFAHGEADAQPRVRAEGTIVAIDFSADGSWMATGQNVEGKGVVSLYSAKYRSRPPVVLPAMSGELRFVGFLASGELVAASDVTGTLIVWRVPAGREVYRVDISKSKHAGQGAVVLGFANPIAPYVGWLAVPKGKQEGRIEVARVPGGQVVTAVSKIRPGAQARWSRQGSHVLIGGAAYNWDSLAQWRPKTPGVSAVSDDGARIVSTSPTSCDGFLTIAEVATGKVLRSVPIGKNACPRWLWFNARGLVWIGPTDKPGEQAVFSWDEKRDRQRRVKRVTLEPKVVAMSAGAKFLALSDGLAVQYVYLR